jgi:hypothetical protein
VKRALHGWLSTISAIGLVAALTSSCAVGVGGYGYGDGYDDPVDIGVDYYMPFGVEYGGWGPGYRVGPYRDGGRHPDGGGHAPRAYRPAAPGHSVPSIPSRPGGSRRR